MSSTVHERLVVRAGPEVVARETDTTMDVFQAIRELRAMRRLKPDPVPEALIREVIEYATYAPSPGNSQAWKFVVVTDPDLRAQIQPYYAMGIDALLTTFYPGDLPNRTPAQTERIKNAWRWQASHLAEIPVLIFACLHGLSGWDFSQHFLQCSFIGAGIFPAVQNLLLACRARGLGACLTTLHMVPGTQVDDLLGLPDGARSCAMIPVGWPMGKFGPVSRLPVDDVIAWNRWS